jgi:hypothetical protein
MSAYKRCRSTWLAGVKGVSACSSTANPYNVIPITQYYISTVLHGDKRVN